MDSDRTEAHIRRDLPGAHIWVGALLILALALIAMMVIWSQTLRHPQQLLFNQYDFFEWLINYQGGLIRRGLVGDLISRLASGQELIAVNRVVFLSSAAYVIASSAVALRFNRYSTGAGLLCALAPTGFFWIALSNGFWSRKEFLFYALIGLVALLHTIWRKVGSRLAAAIALTVIVLSAVVFPFAHEGYMFFCGLYFSIVIYEIVARYVSNRAAKLVVVTFAAFGAMLFVVLLVFKGNHLQSELIWRSIRPEMRALSPVGDLGYGGGIAAVGAPVMNLLAESASTILSGLSTYYAFVLGIGLLILGFAHAKLHGGRLAHILDRKFVVNFSLVVLSFLPLFALGTDWGRWIVGIYFVMSIMLGTDALVAAPESFATVASQILTRRNLVLLLAVVSLLTRTPVCCLGNPTTSLLNPNAVVAIRDFVKQRLHYQTVKPLPGGDAR